MGAIPPDRHRPAGRHLDHHAFYVGWYGDEDSSEDRAGHAAGRRRQAELPPGEKARLHIEAPFAGQALVAIATDRMPTTCTVAVPAGGTTVEIPVDGRLGRRRLCRW